MLFNKERALQKMERHKLDGLVASHWKNVYYSTDYLSNLLYCEFFEGTAASIVPRWPSIPATFIVPEFDLPYLMENPTWMPEVRTLDLFRFENIFSPERVLQIGEENLTAYQRELAKLAAKYRHNFSHDIVEAVSKAIKDLGLTRAHLGFDDPMLAQHVTDALGLDPKNVVNAWDIFKQIRMVKTPDEITLVRKAAQINARAMKTAMDVAHEGVNWGEVCRAHREAMVKEGAVYAGHDRGLLFGGESHAEHVSAAIFDKQNFTLKKGMHVIFDSLGRYRGYHCDAGRIGYVGQPSERYRQIYRAVYDNLQRLKSEMLRPGKTAFDVSAFGFRVMKESGVPNPEAMLSLLHGVGLDILELPSSYTGGRDNWALEENMAVNVDWFYFGLPAEGECHIESTYLIKKDGPCESLYPNLLEELRVL